jgi:hypothetical protein
MRVKFFPGRYRALIVEADRDFSQRRVVIIQGGGKRRRGYQARKDLRALIGTLPPVDIFFNRAPARPLFQLRNVTA